MKAAPLYVCLHFQEHPYCILFKESCLSSTRPVSGFLCPCLSVLFRLAPSQPDLWELWKCRRLASRNPALSCISGWAGAPVFLKQKAVDNSDTYIGWEYGSHHGIIWSVGLTLIISFQTHYIPRIQLVSTFWRVHFLKCLLRASPLFIPLLTLLYFRPLTFPQILK